MSDRSRSVDRDAAGSTDGPRKFWESPHDYEGKIIHVGTPGIFHRMHPKAPLSVTYCGRSMDGARSTDHKLADYSPCAVCFAPRSAS